MATIPVKFMSSRRSAGAPVLNGTTGSMVTLLKACLVNGFNSKSVISLSVAGTVATLQVTGHGFLEDEVVLLSGWNEPVFNGEFRVKAGPLTDSFTIDVGSGAPASGSGAGSVCYAPLGWEETFTNDSSKSVFRSKDVTGTRYSLRVVDDGSSATTRNGGARNAYFGMCEKVVGLDTFDRQRQASVQKSQTADTTARPWFIVGDGKRFYLGVEWSAAFPGLNYVYFFGDFTSYRAADAHNCLCVGLSSCYGADTDDPGLTTYNTYESAYYLDACMGADFTFTKPTGMFLGRGYHQFGSFVEAMSIVGVGGGYNRLRMSAGGWSPAGANPVPFPNPVDNSVIVTGPMFVQENTNLAIRGVLNGLYLPLHQIRPVNDVFPKVNVGGSMRNMYVAQMSALTSGYTVRGQLAFDVTGPWE